MKLRIDLHRMGSRFLPLTVLAVLVGGCNSPTSQPPARIDAMITGVDIRTDLLVLEDIKGPKPLVDVPRCQFLADTINTYLAEAFTAAGIPVGDREVSAVGLRYAGLPTPPVLVKQISDSEPVEQAPPYWIADSYVAASERGLLQNAMEDLQRAAVRPRSNDLDIVSASARALATSRDSSHLVLVLLEAAEVPSSKQVKQMIATTLISLGHVTTSQATQLRFRIGVVDVKSGHFVWISDLSRMGGGLITPENLRSLVDEFLKHLPAPSDTPELGTESGLTP